MDQSSVSGEKRVAVRTSGALPDTVNSLWQGAKGLSLFETGSLHVAVDDLELQRPSCLCPPSVGITGVYHNFLKYLVAIVFYFGTDVLACPKSTGFFFF